METYNKLNISEAVRNTVPKRKFELSEEQTQKIKDYSSLILNLLGAVGLISMAVLAPNALQAFKVFDQKRNRNFRRVHREKKLLRTFYYLKQKNYIDFHKTNSELKAIITEKGKLKLRRLNLETLHVPKSNWWDGKYWQVAADIPTKYRKGADALRNKLKQMGFYSLQRTLWFYPYDPREQIETLANSYNIDRFVTVMKISKFDSADEKVLNKFFRETGVI